MSTSRRTAVATAATAVVCALAGAPAASAEDPEVGLRDSLYILPLAPPSASPACNVVFCPVAQPFAAVGSGPDAGVSGLRVAGVAFAPPGVAAEARSEPLPYDGAGDKGVASLSFSADRVAQGSGGTVLTGVRLEEVGGGVVAELPASDLPLDGTRRTAGPVAISPSAMTPGKAYVAVATWRFTVPSGGDVAARIFAPRLLALGPEKDAASTTPLKVRSPRATLTGRRLRVSVRCPAGPARCDVATRSSSSGRTLGKGTVDLQAGSEHTFTYRLTAAQLRRARRVGSITSTLRLEDEKGRKGTARSTLKVPRR